MTDNYPLAEALDRLRRFRASLDADTRIDEASGLTVADLDVVLAQAQRALPRPYSGRERRGQWHDWTADGSVAPPSGFEFVDIFYDTDAAYETVRVNEVDWYKRGRPPLSWRRSQGPARRRSDD